jgi:acyl carrier protein
MGLDGVELLLAVEDHFGITATEADAEKMETVGGLHDFVFREVCKREGAENVVEADLWCQLLDLIVGQLGVKKSRIHRDARFVEDLGAG